MIFEGTSLLQKKLVLPSQKGCWAEYPFEVCTWFIFDV